MHITADYDLCPFVLTVAAVDCGTLTSLIVTVRWLAEGNNTEHVSGGAQVSPQSAGGIREERF